MRKHTSFLNAFDLDRLLLSLQGRKVSELTIPKKMNSIELKCTAVGSSVYILALRSISFFLV